MYQRQLNKKQKQMQSEQKEDAFDFDISLNFLNERKSDFSNEEPTSLMPESKNNQIMAIDPSQLNIDKYLSWVQNTSSFADKIEENDVQILEQKSSTVIDCSNNQQSQPNKFRTLRNGKSGPPKPLSIENKFINKVAMKNALQFYAYILHRYFNQGGYVLSTEQHELIQNLKKYPSVKNFNELFERDGNIRIRLIQFFQPSNLWRIILTSRFRHYQVKLIMKKIGQRIRKGFIHHQFNGLSYIKIAK